MISHEDLAANAGIRTTVPAWTRGKLASGYALSDFVAPGFAAGAAAPYRAYHPTATAAQIRADIVDGGVPTPALMSTTASGRRLNAEGF